MSAQRSPRPIRLHTVSEIARMVGRPRRTVLYQLTRLIARAETEGRAIDWAIRFSSPCERAMWLFNLSALRRAHPALFERRYVTRPEFEVLEDRVAHIETAVDALALRARSVFRPLAKTKAGPRP